MLGPNEVYRPSLIRAQQITDIDAAALAALINAEAAKLPNGQWNPNSKAGTSSAARADPISRCSMVWCPCNPKRHASQSSCEGERLCHGGWRHRRRQG